MSYELRTNVPRIGCLSLKNVSDLSFAGRRVNNSLLIALPAFEYFDLANRKQ